MSTELLTTIMCVLFVLLVGYFGIKMKAQEYQAAQIIINGCKELK